MQEIGEVFYSENFKIIKQVNNKNIVGQIHAGKYDYLEFKFTKSDLSKCKTLYPWATDDLLNQYFNDTTNSYYKTESYWEYDNNGIQREHKYTALKPEYKTVANQMYVNFIKDYAKLIPYK